MQKIRIIRSLLIAFGACALCAFAATPALAVNTFLLSGAAITETIPVTVETEEFLLQDMGAPGEPDILCSLIWDGFLEAEGKKGEVTEALMLNGELLAASALNEKGVLTAGDDIECESDNGTCTNPVLVVVLELPWLLVADFSDPEHKPTKEPTLTIVCKTIIGTIEDACHGGIGAESTNEVNGVLLEFSENAVTTPPLNCSVGGEKEGLLQGEVLISSTRGVLSIS